MPRAALLELTHVRGRDVIEVLNLKSRCYFALNRFREAEHFGLWAVGLDAGNVPQNWELLSKIAVSRCTSERSCAGGDRQAMLAELADAGAVFLRLGCIALPLSAEMHYLTAKFLGFFDLEAEALEELRECLKLAPRFAEVVRATPGLAQLLDRI